MRKPKPQSDPYAGDHGNEENVRGEARDTAALLGAEKPEPEPKPEKEE